MACYVVLVKGTPSIPGVHIEGLDKRDTDFQAIIEKLGFMIAVDGRVMNKSRGTRCYVPNMNVLLLSSDQLYVTEVLSILRCFRYKIAFTSGTSSSGIWTLEK